MKLSGRQFIYSKHSGCHKDSGRCKDSQNNKSGKQSKYNALALFAVTALVSTTCLTGLFPTPSALAADTNSSSTENTELDTTSTSTSTETGNTTEDSTASDTNSGASSTGGAEANTDTSGTSEADSGENSDANTDSTAETNSGETTNSTTNTGAEISALSELSELNQDTDDTYSMPDNPGFDLPTYIHPSISDDATVVSEEFAVTTDGVMVYLETGEQVTDPNYVGTATQQPDPLLKTDGLTFIPVSVATVREAIAEAYSNTGDTDTQSSDTQDRASTLSIPGNDYGAYWGTYNGEQAFFMKDGTVYASPASAVIDVSEHQSKIDWEKVKAAGVEGVIIRLSYGWDNRLDYYAEYNVSECKRLGIPFGVYWFSYAETASNGTSEGNSTVAALQELGIKASDLSYPIYYDLEDWSGSWIGHTPPSSPSLYASIYTNWANKLKAAGYSNLGVYSNANRYLNELNHSTILSVASWVASYGPTPIFEQTTTIKGWQYSSTGKINGISGNVDLNAFAGTNSLEAVDRVSMDALASQHKNDLPDGTYTFASKANAAYVMDVKSGSTANKANIQLYKTNETGAQQWIVSHDTTGYVTLTNVKSGRVMDAESSTNTNGTNIQQYSNANTYNQKWVAVKNSDGSYTFYSANANNKVIDVTSAKMANGTNIQLYNSNSTNAQKWVLTSTTLRADMDEMAAANKNALADGTYVITTSLATNYAIDVPSASTANAVKIQLYRRNVTEAQQWIVSHDTTGYVTLTNVKSGRVLDVTSGNITEKNQLQQYNSNNTNAQKWVAVKNSDGSYTLVSALHPNYVIDLNSASVSNKTAIQLYRSNNTSAQKWVFTSLDTLRSDMDALAAANKNVIADGTYTIANFSNSTMVLDVASGSTANNARVQIYKSNSTNAQKWVISHDSKGYITIKNVGSGRVLDVPNSSMTEGTNLQQYSSTGAYNQKWIAIKNTDGSIQLQSALYPDLVLDIESGTLTNKTAVQIYHSNNTNAQKWTFTKIG